MKKIVFGVIIMMLGVFLLFRNMGAIPEEIVHWVLSWQSLLIAIGAILLFDRKTDNKNAGLILILVGSVFLLPKMMGVQLSGILVPALIIAAGIFFIVRATTQKGSSDDGGCRSEWKEYQNFEKKSFEKTTFSGNGCIQREYIFNSSKEKWNYGKLRNIAIEAVFSGVELDFSQTELADDTKVAARISVSSVFSGVTLYVPDDWNIILQKTGVFGGFVDKRPRNIEADKEKIVILELEAVFGGGEIRCYE
ncbi:MAG: cell wall-active antibiotics response protein [Dysgonamonadaceae bacterium]|jgi:predicted membrane protein|nr:cell wall-active antibiotics response protein [Dysgonamonadaceae bacterium]